MNSLTLQYYYGGHDVAYRVTPEGVELLADGLVEIRELTQGMSQEATPDDQDRSALSPPMSRLEVPLLTKKLWATGDLVLRAELDFFQPHPANPRLLGWGRLVGFEANDFFFQLIRELLQRLSGELACPDIRHGFTVQIAKAVFQQLKLCAGVFQLPLALEAHRITSITPLGTASRSDP